MGDKYKLLREDAEFNVELTFIPIFEYKPEINDYCYAGNYESLYKTSDGTLFLSEEDAIQYEMKYINSLDLWFAQFIKEMEIY